MTRGRIIPWIVTLCALAAFVVAIVPMTQRIRAFNAASLSTRFHAEPIVARSFQIGRYPPVTLTDAEAEGEGRESGQAALKLEFAGKDRLIPVKRPPAVLPTLAMYDEWVKVLAINEVGLDGSGNSVALPGTERLIIAVRRTPEGYDPESWGGVRRIEWVFDLYELQPDGSVVQTLRRWPRKPRSEKRLQREAAMDESAPPAALRTPAEIDAWRQTVRTAKRLIAIPRLEDRTVEHFAAMHVMPKLNMPEHKFDDTALSPEVLGWTLPVSMCAVLIFPVGLVFALSPRRRSAAQ